MINKLRQIIFIGNFTMSSYRSLFSFAGGVVSGAALGIALLSSAAVSAQLVTQGGGSLESGMLSAAFTVAAFAGAIGIASVVRDRVIPVNSSRLLFVAGAFSGSFAALTLGGLLAAAEAKPASETPRPEQPHAATMLDDACQGGSRVVFKEPAAVSECAPSPQ